MSKKVIMASAAAVDKNDGFQRIPLRDWMAMEMKKENLMKQGSPEYSTSRGFKESIIRKTTIAYGIVELILRCPKDNDKGKDGILHIDNFTVHVSKSTLQHQPWDDIKGVSMISPKLSLSIEEPAYLRCLFEPDESFNQFGRHLEVEEMEMSEETSTVHAAVEVIRENDDNDEVIAEIDASSNNFYSIATILHELFASEAFPKESPLRTMGREAAAFTPTSSTEEPAQKKIKSTHEKRHHNNLVPGVKDYFAFQTSYVNRMQQLGIPSSLCLMEQNLLDAASTSTASKGDEHKCSSQDNAYKSMKDVAKDLHLLLLDPDRFLFDSTIEDTQDIQLEYRKNKLYGRDKEEKLITDSFCRVSRGKSEAFFIGGFSGCGKTMLVNTLRARVNVTGGYVVHHKFDALSQGSSLSGIISAINQLCSMIRRRTTPQSLAVLAKKVRDEFGADIVFLARILKNIVMLSADFNGLVTEEGECRGDTMNARSVGFTLLRFLRLVSSRTHPIMFFLDDLQWADSTALDVIHTFLSDTIGTCMFLVGTYRDNEVDDKHPIFELTEKLKSSNVPTTKVVLAGLQREDLNTMLSDALCLYPRMCYSLTDIVMQKTNGNPFFTLEFMKSLKDRGLLRYNSYHRRWSWDDGVILTENITDNVMHLLSHKMTALADHLQLVLKVMACFGTITKALVINLLDGSIEFAGVGDGIKRAIDGGFVEKNNLDGDFKFVHDKIREAAYNLIPEGDKKQFHYNLGKVLYSLSEASDADEIVLLTASQLYHGKECIPNDESCIPIVQLSIEAGKKAIDGCHHETAYSYLEAALPLLSHDSWKSHYDVTLRLHYMMANAANASCKYDEAESLLQSVLKEGRCTKDKLPSYSLLCQIFHAQGKVVDAYNTCSSILTQLGEKVSDSVPFETVRAMIAETLRSYEEVYSDDWLTKNMEDSNLQYAVKFYGIMAESAFFFKHEQLVQYLICSMVQLSLRHGACQYTPAAFLKLSNVINFDGSSGNIAHRIANDAMSISKRFNVSELSLAELNFEFVYSVGYLEWFHTGIERLRGGFQSSLSSGNANMGFLCAAQSTLLSSISGEKKLTLLLDEIEYYLTLLHTYNSEMTRRFLLISRTTVSMLIDKDESVREGAFPGFASDSIPPKLLSMIHFNQAIQNYWLGYSERCCHFAEKCLDSFPNPGRLYRVFISFYHGLNMLDMLKKKKSAQRRKAVKEMIATLKFTVSQTDHNFRNKLELLEAEFYGLDAKHSQAVISYDAAIASAREYKFVHEEGLACEKAGLYHKKVADFRRANSYFEKARVCYEEWGSQMKVQSIQREIDAISAAL